MNITFSLVSTWAPGFHSAILRHYTESRGAPPGKKLAWEVFEDSKLIGWLGLGEPAYKLAARRRLGIADARPLPGTVCNFIFRRESGSVRGSDILRAWHPVAELDWLQRYGWQPVHWETLVLPTAIDSSVPGACFRRAGYRSLGLTTGRSARRPKGHTRGPRVWNDAERKLVLYRGPLHRMEQANV
jgi:hypothetical protein